MTVQVGYKALIPGAIRPSKATKGSAGMDLAYPGPCCYIEPGVTICFPLGFALQIPEGYEGQIRSRSGLAKAGVVVANSPGTVDADYRGEVMVLLHNQGPVKYRIDGGARIAQLVIAEVPQIEFVDWKDDVTWRGVGGFGSTGI